MKRRDTVWRLQHWDDAHCVLATARAGSFRAGGAELELDASTLSRRIHGLERALGLKLFDRRAHGMTLTAAGNAFVDQAKAMEAAAEAIETALAAVDKQTSGLIRLRASEDLAALWLPRVLKEIIAGQTETSLELFIGESTDPTNRETDLTLAYLPPSDDRALTFEAGAQGFSAFAARSYVEFHGIPADEAGLARHALIDYTGWAPVEELRPWRDLIQRHSKISLRTLSWGSFLECLRAGWGVGLLPNFCADQMVDLVRLSAFEAQSRIWLSVAQKARHKQKVAALLAFLRRRLKRVQGAWSSS